MERDHLKIESQIRYWVLKEEMRALPEPDPEHRGIPVFCNVAHDPRRGETGRR